jgi:GNAT superfamily N-acetyltransferase
MDNEYTILQLDEPDEAAWKAVGGGIRDYNIQQAGVSGHRSLCFLVRAPDGEIAGGLIGETYWGWLYINLLIVKEELRGLGYGHRLLTLAEEEARKRGVKTAYLDTFSFQAPEFYKRHGYQVFGELQDFPPGHQRYFLMKHL